MKKNNNPKETVAIGRVGSPSGLRGEVRINLYAQDSNNLKEGKVLLLQHTEKTDSRGADGKSVKILSVRLQKEKPVIKLEGFGDRTAVEALRGMEVSIAAGDMEALPEGEHYVRDLIGCSVIDIAAANRNEAVKATAAGGAAAARDIAAADPAASVSSAYADLAAYNAAQGSAAETDPANGGRSNGRLVGVLCDVIQNTAQSILEVETPEGKTVLIPAVDAFLRNIDEESGIIEVELIPGFY